MTSPSRNRDQQVQLTVFDNEPTARMAEQRLSLEGIPVMVRSLHGGPGLWGSAYNLPHGLYVYQSDAPKAREILGLPHREEADSRHGGSTSRTWLIVLIMLVVIFILSVPTFGRLFE